MSKTAPFSSECPKCSHERAQPGYSPDELLELLEEGAVIEAYCMSCDEHWEVSTEERADLARSLSKK